MSGERSTARDLSRAAGSKAAALSEREQILSQLRAVDLELANIGAAVNAGVKMKRAVMKRPWAHQPKG